MKTTITINGEAFNDPIARELELMLTLAEDDTNDDWRYCEPCDSEMLFVDDKCIRCTALKMMEARP